MLEKVREPKRAKNFKKYIATFFFALICLVFVFMGITPDRGGTGIGLAAEVNDEVISVADFQERLAMVESQMGSMMNNLPSQQRQIRSRALRADTLKDLIRFELLYQNGSKLGVLPIDAAVRDMIVNVPGFQTDGRFARELYEQFLEGRQLTAKEFEDKIKREVVISKLRDVLYSVWAEPTTLQALTEQARNTKLNAEFVKLDSVEIVEASVGEAEVSTFSLDASNQEKIKTYYTANTAEFSKPEEVRARHILIKGSEESALKAIQDIRKDLTKDNFAEKAKQFSQDEGSKLRGGDLNYFRRGQMVKEFDETAFGLNVGVISEPVKTSFGYHLILVEDHKKASTQDLDSVKNRIARKLLVQSKTDNFFKDWTEKLKDSALLESSLKSHKLTWKETGEFSLTAQSLPQVDAGEDVINALLTLKNPGEMYSSIIRVGSTGYILRMKKMALAKEEVAQPKNNNPMMSRFSGGGNEIMRMWTEDMTKTARIRMNDRLLQ